MSENWWQPIELAIGETWSKTVGRAELTVEHDQSEWRVGATPASGPSPAHLRIATSADTKAIVLHPRLADRAVVARLQVPVHIAPGDSATIYVGSPLWAEVELAPSGARAGELRFADPPNTWFGPNTRTGELCFASRTSGRLKREEIEHQGDRAITTISIENTSALPLVFERVRIPTPHLSLHLAADGTLWTDRVRVQHAEDSFSDEIESGPPPDLGDCTRLAEPRSTERPNLLVRAFGALL